MTSVYTPERVETKRATPGPGLALLLFIALLAVLSIYLQAPPAILPEGAPPDSFSAERALKHLRVIARRPHPLGTAEHAAVRDYIQKELAALGVSTEVQDATVTSARWGSPYRVGRVQNIIGRIPGTGGGRAVVLASHYDSAPTSPGASDDGSGVSVLLETARALKSQPPLKNDLVLLFTDGEEVALLGAEAFAQRHPLAKNVGVVLNFEARGSSGPSMMFETSDGNGWMMREFAAAAPAPAATSLSNEIYKRLPNDTDLSAFKKAGFPGLNFAFIGQLNRYHTAVDSLENIDGRSIQHHGSNALALARHFGELDLGRHEQGNDVYFNPLGFTFVRYPQWLAVPLAALAALLFAVVVVSGLRRGALTARGVLFGAAALVACAVVSSVVVSLAWAALRSLDQGITATPWRDAYNGEWYAAGFVLLTVAICAALYNWFRRKTSVYNLTAGALLCWAVLALLVGFAAPGASYLFTWPLLFTLAGLYLLMGTQEGRPLRRLLVLAACAVPGILLVAPLIQQVFVAMTPAAAGTVVILEVLLVGLLVPHLGLLAEPRRWLVPGGFALLALALLVAGLSASGFDGRHPKYNNLFYGLDADAGKTVWASIDRNPDEWTSQFFGANSQRVPLPNLFPLDKLEFLTAEAPPVALAPPEAVLLEQQAEPGMRTLRLRLTSPRGGSVVSAYVDPKREVVAATINGEAIDVVPEAWAIYYYGFPPEGAELTLKVKGDGPLTIRVDDRTYDLPQMPSRPITPRPSHIIPMPSPNSDVTLVSKSYTF